MILIADSGSTKTDWALADKNTGTFTLYHTIGFNPYFIDSEGIYESLANSLALQFNTDEVTAIYFYGAGCSTPEKQHIVQTALKRVFKQASTLLISHDLLGSARALLGNQTGFAAILGTGANTCIYDGNTCTHNIDSLGYLLGDEGSGSYIGRRFLRDFMRKRLSAPLQARFAQRFEIENNDQIYKTLFTTQFPNRYLAGFCKFADEYSHHPYVKNTVREAFNDFFKNLVSKYPNYTNYTLNCVGSVAFSFKDILEEVATAHDMKMGKVIQSPVGDLVNYHLEQQ
jgi:N-acetylglucosamine kinase-like BadF-type ATPase